MAYIMSWIILFVKMYYYLFSVRQLRVFLEVVIVAIVIMHVTCNDEL